MDIKEKIKTLPSWSGVYMFKDAENNVIYVGKANNLKKRVSSYFHHKFVSGRIANLVSNIKDVEYLLTGSQEEALIYEASLIKKYMPRYNAALKDDKSYPFLKLTMNEDFPRLLIVRRPKKDDKSLYFGPYTSAKLLRGAVAIMRKMFPLRTCRKMPKNTCLMYDLKQCMGPCVKKINKKEYSKILKDLILFLEGKKDLLIKSLSKKMREYSENKQYENAALLRDQISALTKVSIAGEEEKTGSVLLKLKKTLKLKYSPFRIEAFDISNIFGKWAVGSMVCFVDGIPKNSDYRRFKIKLVSGIDDYAMMREVLKRRYSGDLVKQLKMPDLILIDGGKGHLSIAEETLKSMAIPIPVISIAKKQEKIFVTWKKSAVSLPQSSDVRQLIQRIRDEAHRFAISYHKHLRKKSQKESVLDKIPGVGEKTKEILIKHFGDIEKIKKASLEELMKVKGISRKTAENIIQWKFFITGR